MSEDMEKEVPIAARRTESLDAPNILKLVSKETSEIFGRVNIVQLIEKSNLAISLVDENNEILGHAAFLDYPPGKHISQSNWGNWLKSMHNIDQSTPMNTLFLHFFVSKSDFSHGSLCEIMRTVFNAVPLLDYVILVVPNGASISGGMAKVFESLEFKEDIDIDKQKHRSFICHRHKHCPVLYIRSARVEDHDDLMPIFDKHNTELTSMYGDFFLSDLIEAEDEDNKSIVADVDGTAVGFMSICTDVNIDILNQCFELKPFNGLKSVPRKDPVKKEAAVEESRVKRESVAKSRPETGFSVTVKTDDESAPSVISVSSPEQKSGPAETPGMSISSLSPGPVDKRGKSPVAKGSFHRTKLKSSKHKTDLQEKIPNKEKTPAKEERPPTPVKTEEKDDAEQELKRAESEMTIKLEKEEHREKHKPEEEAVTEEIEQEADPVESAVSIQLFCVDEKFEMRSMDFLPKVFELFPEKDYCIITIPHTVPEFPLLQTFKRATPKAESTMSQELYVFNRSGLLSSVNVRQCQMKDVSAIEKLVHSIEGKDLLLKDVQQHNDARRDEDGTEIKCYIAECMDQIVGVSVIRQEEDIEYIRAHYNIEDFVYFNHHERQEHGHLHHFVLNPAFSHYSKHFLKEILRLSHKSCLYYPLYKSMPSSEFSKFHSLATCLTDLVPIRPRRQIIYPAEDLGVNAPSERILKEQECYSLYHINRKLTLEPKVVINVRIVVIGASDVGLSCLDALVNCPHLCFNNLTLVSENGLQLNDTTSLSKSLCFSQKELDAMSLSTWINVVQGKMTKIDRVNKKVVIDNGRQIPYDHLLICTGQQYQYAVPTGVDITTLATTSEALQQKMPKVNKGFIPNCVFRVNRESDLNDALRWIEDNFLSSYGELVVYGATLEAYAFIQHLLNDGVPGERIVFVKPPPSTPSCFNNSYVEKTVEDALNDKGVLIHNGYTLAQWNDGEKDAYLRCSTFTSSKKPLRVECQGFFCFQEKRVDYEAFQAINDCCLVYDGKLVIDSNFRTNDPLIRSAGSVTKYARKYHSDAWTHCSYNSREVGVRLAESILNMFDPTLEEDLNNSPLDEKLIPVYGKPKMSFAVLPGGYNYLHIGKPSLSLPLETLMAQSDYGKALVTKPMDKDTIKYFRLHLNQYNTVETITCLSVEAMDIENLICLYGIHERYLNNLVGRYEEGLIEDFFSYFKESWCLAIFHDRFGDFRAEIHEILAEREADDMLSLEEKVRKLIHEDLVLSKEQRDYLADSYVTSNAKKLIEQRLLSYLSYNHYHLPMYARPGMV